MATLAGPRLFPPTLTPSEGIQELEPNFALKVMVNSVGLKGKKILNPMSPELWKVFQAAKAGVPEAF